MNKYINGTLLKRGREGVFMRKIILVEDEFYIRETLKRTVDWNEEGYEIIGEATNGEQAVAKTKELQPDLVLLDINLPDMNGFEVISQLKQQGVAARIIIITGYDTFEFAKKAISYGVTEYLLKPVIPAELSAALRKVKEDIHTEENKEKVFHQLTDDICRLIPMVDEKVLKSHTQIAMDQESNHVMIQKIKQFVNENLADEKLNVEYVSQKMFLNLSYLSHFFKKETDQGLREYIFTQRMDHAYEIAMNSGKGLAEIAELVGFKDADYFGKCFKRHFGISVSEIRKIQNKYKK